MSLKYLLASAMLSLLAGACHARAPLEMGLARLPSLSTPQCEAIPYEPLPVFNTPGGVRIGLLVLDNPDYAKATSKDCLYRPRVFFQPEGLNRVQPVKGWMREDNGWDASVFEDVYSFGSIWLRLQSAHLAIWIRKPSNARYQSLELNLVQGFDTIPELCGTDGVCLPTTKAFGKLVHTAGDERRSSCTGSAYEVVGTLQLPDGRRAYKGVLADELLPKYSGKLPIEVVVPTYDRLDRWTGLFIPGGCEGATPQGEPML
jgi:hypothetical protein